MDKLQLKVKAYKRQAEEAVSSPFSSLNTPLCECTKGLQFTYLAFRDSPGGAPGRLLAQCSDISAEGACDAGNEIYLLRAKPARTQPIELPQAPYSI